MFHKLRTIKKRIKRLSSSPVISHPVLLLPLSGPHQSNQVCKNVEEKGKLLGYVLSRFRADVSMESAFQTFFLFISVSAVP